MGEPFTSSSRPPSRGSAAARSDLASKHPTASGIEAKDAVAVGVDVASALRAPAVPRELGAAADARARAGSVPLSEPPPAGSSWRPSASLPVYSRYGRFELLGRIARGGMAEILLARERALGDAHRHVVVKRILPQSAEDEEYVKMFLAEGRLMMSLSHPNICHVYDVGQDGPTWFIAMEWVHGEALMKVIRRARNRGLGVPPVLAARIAADVAAALHHAHHAKDGAGRALGLVHRDVSPHNVMITYDGAVKLLDFGVAKVTSSSEHTTTGIVKGKFAYMAPEQCLGRDLDPRADVFALGICLFETLTGRALYRRGNDYETLRAIIKEPVPSPRAVDPRIPEALDHIVRIALQKKRDHRFATAQDMQLALEKFLAEGQMLASSALVGRMMRRLFADELRTGPTLDPIGPASPSAPGADHPPAPAVARPAPAADHPPAPAVARPAPAADHPPAPAVARAAPAADHPPSSPDQSGPRPRVSVPDAPPRGSSKIWLLALVAALLGTAALVADHQGVLLISAPPAPESAPAAAPAPESAAAAAPAPESVAAAAPAPESVAAAAPESAAAAAPESAAAAAPAPVPVLLPESARAPGASPAPEAARAGGSSETAPASDPSTPVQRPRSGGSSETAPASDPSTPLQRARSGGSSETAPTSDRATRAPPSRRDPTGFGTLSLNTSPWSRVYVNGRLLGTTPIGAARVPAGRLRLRLEDRDGHTHHHTVRVARGGHLERFIDLTAR